MIVDPRQEESSLRLLLIENFTIFFCHLLLSTRKIILSFRFFVVLLSYVQSYVQSYVHNPSPFLMHFRFLPVTIPILIQFAEEISTAFNNRR